MIIAVLRSKNVIILLLPTLTNLYIICTHHTSTLTTVFILTYVFAVTVHMFTTLAVCHYCVVITVTRTSQQTPRQCHIQL